MAQSINNETFYSDIDLYLTPHPKTGDVVFLKNSDAVKRSLKHLIKMYAYDIPFEKDYHPHLMDLLFGVDSSTNSNVLEERIRWIVNKLEPRAIIISIDVNENSEQGIYEILIKFKTRSIMIEDSVTI